MNADSSTEVVSRDEDSVRADKLFKIRGGIFLASVTGISILSGFSMTLASAKKRDPQSFGKGLDIHGSSASLPEGGVSLALRALGRGTIYSVSGFTIFCVAIWKLMGVHNMQEFREKVRSMMPVTIPKPKNQGRSDFASIRELITYLSQESDSKKGNDIQPR